MEGHGRQQQFTIKTCAQDTPNGCTSTKGEIISIPCQRHNIFPSNKMGVLSKAVIVFGALIGHFYYEAVSNGVEVTVLRNMACSSERAFQAVTDFDIMPQISPDVVGYEFVDDPPMHLYMKFSETRRMGKGSELVTHLQVTEYRPQEPQHARMVADTHGTIWDTTFDVRPMSSSDTDGKEVVLKISMHAQAHELIPKLLNPIMQVLFRSGLNSHIDQVKTWCEQEHE